MLKRSFFLYCALDLPPWLWYNTDFTDGKSLHMDVVRVSLAEKTHEFVFVYCGPKGAGRIGFINVKVFWR